MAAFVVRYMLRTVESCFKLIEECNEYGCLIIKISRNDYEVTLLNVMENTTKLTNERQQHSKHYTYCKAFNPFAYSNFPAHRCSFNPSLVIGRAVPQSTNHSPALNWTIYFDVLAKETAMRKHTD